MLVEPLEMPAWEPAFSIADCLLGLGLAGLPLEVVSQTHLRQGEDQPLRRVEVVPPGSVAVIPKVQVMIFMLALSESHEGNPPTISAAIMSPVRLRPPQVADGIDAKGGI